MALRFRKSINLGGGVKFNLSKSGIGVSGGVKGFRIGANSKGVYRSMSLPGTGIYDRGYISTNSRGKGIKQASGGSRAISTPTRQTAASSSQPLPKELAAGGNGSIVFLSILGIIMLFMAWPAGLLILVGTIVYASKKPKNLARQEFLLARKLVKFGDCQGAIEAYTKVLEAKPEINQVYAELAPCYEALGDWANAADALNRSPHDPGDVSFKLTYARYLRAAKRYDECINIIQSLPVELKQNVAIINLEAGAFLNMGKPELALEVLQQGPMRKRNLDDITLLFFYLLGLTYKVLGDKKKATQYLNKVAAHDMNYENVQELLTDLQNVAK